MSKRKILSRWRRSLTHCLETPAFILAAYKRLDIHNLVYGHPALPVSNTFQSPRVTWPSIHTWWSAFSRSLTITGRHVFYNVSESPMTFHFKSKLSHFFVLRKGRVQRRENCPRKLRPSLFCDIMPCNIPDDRRPELNGLRSLKFHQRFFLKSSLREIFYFISSVLSPVLSSESAVYYHMWFTHIHIYTLVLLNTWHLCFLDDSPWWWPYNMSKHIAEEIKGWILKRLCT